MVIYNRSLFWCTLFVVFSIRSVLFGQSFMVEGIIKYERPIMSRGVLTTNMEKETFSFNISVDNDEWRLHLTTEQPIINYDYCEVVYNNNTIYYVRSIKSWVEDQIRAGNTVGTNKAIGVVLRQAVPIFSVNHELGSLWLTYASMKYLKDCDKNNALCPLTRSVGKSGLVGTLDAYKQKIILHNDGNIYCSPTKMLYLENKLTNHYNGIFTNSIYTVEAFTNIGSIKIPILASVKTYYPYRAPGNAQADITLREHYTIIANRVELNNVKPPGLPSLRDIIHISDLRFMNRDSHPIKAFDYYTKDKWYTDSEVYRLPEYKRAFAEARDEIGPDAISSRRYIILSVFGIFLVTSLLIMIKYKWFK